MQALFANNPAGVAAFRSAISDARFSRYLAEAHGSPLQALELYHWNSRLSQAMYLPLQMWEISLRNKLNEFLIWKHNPSWPYDSRYLRNAANPERRRLEETKKRLTPKGQITHVSTDRIVADLSAGFWVALVMKSYDVPYAWRYNLSRIFPNKEKLDREKTAEQCGKLLELRNRVAHHEPIFHLPLQDRHQELLDQTAWMCGSVSSYIQAKCNFAQVWADRPL